MPRPNTEDNSVGKRIGQLLRQYALRITYAEGQMSLYEEEREKASASSKNSKALKATVAREVWAVYAKNLATRKNELERAVLNALAGYTDRQKRIWWLYFIENKSGQEIAYDPGVNTELRTVYRIIAAMRDEMELNFELPMPKEETSSKRKTKWGAEDLASFLDEKPSQEYVDAISDMLDYGLVNLDMLEFDPMFQRYVEKGERPC